LSSVKAKYEDIKKMYNRELIFTLNLIVGLGALVYYIYLNQDVLPSIPELPKMGDVMKSMPTMSNPISPTK